jgi:hypothetical protein
MMDFASITEAARDPLVIILGVFIFGGVATYLFSKDIRSGAQSCGWFF